MEYCCHVSAGTPSQYLDILDKLSKRVFGTVGPILATSLEPLGHRRSAASLNLMSAIFHFFHQMTALK